MNYRVIRSDELYHFGVPGMRWGHRKNPAHYYAKRVKKLNRLDKKYRKMNLKSKKMDYKSAKLEYKGSERALVKSAKYKDKASKLARKAEKAKSKGIKVYNKLEKKMRNVPLSDLGQLDLESARRFADRYING